METRKLTVMGISRNYRLLVVFDHGSKHMIDMHMLVIFYEHNKLTSVNFNLRKLSK